MNNNEPNLHRFYQPGDGDEVEGYQPGNESGNQILPTVDIADGREADPNLAAVIDPVPAWATLPINTRLTMAEVFGRLRTFPAILYKFLAFAFRPAYPIQTQANPGNPRYTTPHLLRAWLPPYETDENFGTDAGDFSRHWAVGTDPFGIFTLAEQTRRTVEEELEELDGFDWNDTGNGRTTQNIVKLPRSSLMEPAEYIIKRPRKRKSSGDSDK